MKKKIMLISLLLLLTLSLYCQVNGNLLVNIHHVTNNTEMMNIVPKSGSLIYRNDNNHLYIYTGTNWQKLSNSETTYETVNLTQGNQTINIVKADKLVGFTLISNSNWLSSVTGRMSGTWMIGYNREKIRCYIQTLEHPYVKFITISVKINNATNEIIFSNYSSRYWNITKVSPQDNLSNNQNSYRLGKIIIIREE